jgi:hypothetical protein
VHFWGLGLILQRSGDWGPVLQRSMRSGDAFCDTLGSGSGDVFWGRSNVWGHILRHFGIWGHSLGHSKVWGRILVHFGIWGWGRILGHSEGCTLRHFGVGGHFLRHSGAGAAVWNALGSGGAFWNTLNQGTHSGTFWGLGTHLGILRSGGHTLWHSGVVDMLGSGGRIWVLWGWGRILAHFGHSKVWGALGVWGRILGHSRSGAVWDAFSGTF